MLHNKMNSILKALNELLVILFGDCLFRVAVIIRIEIFFKKF